MRRYKTHLVVRPAYPTERDYTVEQETQCNVSALDETDARRKVIHQALFTGFFVSHFLSVEVGREV